MTRDDDIRDAQRTTWAGLSSAWDRWEAVITDQLAPVGAAMIEALGISDGHRHLDVASGTGEPGLTIATTCPGAQVVLTDLVPEMMAVAGRRAAARGVTNVETVVCSADDLPFDDATFDTVSIRFGYMFLPDLSAATAEMVRVLRPGGRLCASVWVQPERNPWTWLVMDAIAAEVPLPPPDPDGPSMYRCAAPGRISALYADAGLRDVAEWDVGVELVTATPEEYWLVMSEHVSLAAAALRQVDAPARQRISGTVVDAVTPYVVDRTVRVPGLARCIVGVKQPG